MSNCPKCHSEVGADAKFCHVCGTALPTSVALHKPLRYELDYEDFRTLPAQIREHFLTDFRQYLRRELNENLEGECLRLMYDTEFFDYMEEYIIELASDVDERYSSERREVYANIDNLLQKKFAWLLDYFFHDYASHLLPCKLTDKALDYNDERPARQINIRQMILDFLDFGSENELYYANIIDIPVKKLQTAIRSFLKYGEREVPLVFCDQTLLKSGAEGFCFTDKGFYWKAHFHKPQKVMYAEAFTLRLNETHLDINGAYFNVNKTLNYKIMKVLVRLQAWAQELN